MMEIRVFWILVYLFVGTHGLPLTALNTLDVEDVQEDDDFTTHTLERLSSAATCLVAGIEYTHGQQIYRKDPCEFCLCLDGEMFCWWQDCPPTFEGPCKERGPFSPCSNGVKPSASTTTQTTSRSTASTEKNSQVRETTDIAPNTYSSNASVSEVSTKSSNDSLTEMSTKSSPKTCTVMGREYKIGEKLPHDTGNCVECTCGSAGQVTCSPNQCAPVGDDINDYRPPGSRSALSDMF